MKLIIMKVDNEADCYPFIEAPGKSKKNVLQM